MWPYKTGDLLKTRFNSYEIFYDRTRKWWSFDIGDCICRFNSTCLMKYFSIFTYFQYEITDGCGIVSMLTCSVGSIPGLFKQISIKLLFDASLERTHYWGERAKTGLGWSHVYEYIYTCKIVHLGVKLKIRHVIWTSFWNWLFSMDVFTWSNFLFKFASIPVHLLQIHIWQS